MLRSPEKVKTQTFAGPGLSRNAECVCKSWVAFSRHQVNHLRLVSVIQFRNVVIDGIALVGWPKCPWLSRLVDRLTVLADALAEKSGVRV